MPPSSARTDAATPAIITSTPEAPAHTLLEDGAAIATGVLLVALGVAFFKQAGLLTGALPGWPLCCTTAPTPAWGCGCLC